MDHLTTDRRSWNMGRIRSRHTKPELIVRSLLHRSGYRFRINYEKLPGSPDIVLPKYKTVVFVHGCFWHRHKNCSRATVPKTNSGFWLKKFQRNVSKDLQIRKKLGNLQWKIIVVWECEVLHDPLSVLDRITLKLEDSKSPRYLVGMNRRKILRLAEKRRNYYLKSKL